MRIGIVTGEYPPMQGGVGDFTREISKAFDLLGHKVHILTRSGCHAEGLSINCILHPEITHWNWSLIRHLKRWVRDAKLEVVNVQYQSAAFDMHPVINLLPSRIANVPVVVTFHDLRPPYLFPKAGPLRQQSVFLLARRASGVIVTNREDQLFLQRHRLYRRTAMIPIGSNIAHDPPIGYRREVWRQQIGADPKETLLGYFGFLNESKGGEDLIEALYRLKKQEIPAKLVLIGGRTGASDPTNLQYAQKIDSLISEMRIEDQIIRTGYVTAEEVSAYLLASDMVVLPFRDGVSFRRGSLMAALVHGCPIISTTPALPLPELVHRENIYLVPPEAPGALAQAVITLRQRQDLSQKLADASRRLSREFQWDSIATSTIRMFDNLGIQR